MCGHESRRNFDHTAGTFSCYGSSPKQYRYRAALDNSRQLIINLPSVFIHSFTSMSLPLDIFSFGSKTQVNVTPILLLEHTYAIILYYTCNTTCARIAQTVMHTPCTLYRTAHKRLLCRNHIASKTHAPTLSVEDIIFT